LIENSGDTFQDKDRLSIEVCKLVAIAGLRDHMCRWLPEGKFLPPTMLAAKAIVGFQAGPKTFVAEGDSFVAAYHRLHKQVVG